MSISKHVRWIGLLSLLASTLALGAVPGTGLRPGEFVWQPEVSPQGPLLMVVSIPEQRAYVYRNGVRIAVSSVSTGKAGKETPAGVYSVLQKHKEHFSNLYDGAPMPFMQRLTWGGIALHAGRVPGYPASHGCIRLPEAFARQLFELTSLGMTVVVSDEQVSAPTWVHPGWLAPGAASVEVAQTDSLEEFSWSPEAAPAGPLTILLSTSDRSVRVLREGVQIGAARFELDGPVPTGTQVLQLQSGAGSGESRFVPGKPRLLWLQVPLAGIASPATVANDIYGAVRVSPAFARALYDNLVPGSTVVVTDMPASPVSADEEILDTAPAGIAPPRP